jgi:hypothetical protein
MPFISRVGHPVIEAIEDVDTPPDPPTIIMLTEESNDPQA